MKLVILTKLYRVALEVTNEEAASAILTTICRGALDCDPSDVSWRADVACTPLVFHFNPVRIYVPGHTVEEAWLEQTEEITGTPTKSSLQSSPQPEVQPSVETASLEPLSASMN